MHPWIARAAVWEMAVAKITRAREISVAIGSYRRLGQLVARVKGGGRGHSQEGTLLIVFPPLPLLVLVFFLFPVVLLPLL